MSYAKREPFVPSPDTVIWRYMDALKFEDLLKTFDEHPKWQLDTGVGQTVYLNEPGRLWFSHPYSFEDDKEGCYPDANQDPYAYFDRMAERDGLSPEEAAERKARCLANDVAPLHDCIFFMAQMHGISCWHANDRESAAMWRDFVSTRNGVAICSTCKDVERSLLNACASPARQAKPRLCAPGYVDYTKYCLPQAGYSGLLSIVQEIHSHENEVRFFAKSPQLAAIPTTFSVPIPLTPDTWPDLKEKFQAKVPDFVKECNKKSKSAYLALRQADPKGFRLPVSLDDLIVEVVVKPGCETNYENAVRELLNNVGLTGKRVRRSSF